MCVIAKGLGRLHNGQVSGASTTKRTLSCTTLDHKNGGKCAADTIVLDVHVSTRVLRSAGRPLPEAAPCVRHVIENALYTVMEIVCSLIRN